MLLARGVARRRLEPGVRHVSDGRIATVFQSLLELQVGFTAEAQRRRRVPRTDLCAPLRPLTPLRQPPLAGGQLDLQA